MLLRLLKESFTRAVRVDGGDDNKVSSEFNGPVNMLITNLLLTLVRVLNLKTYTFKVMQLFRENIQLV